MHDITWLSMYRKNLDLIVVLAGQDCTVKGFVITIYIRAPPLDSWILLLRCEGFNHSKIYNWIVLLYLKARLPGWLFLKFFRTIRCMIFDPIFPVSNDLWIPIFLYLSLRVPPTRQSTCFSHLTSPFKENKSKCNIFVS